MRAVVRITPSNQRFWLHVGSPPGDHTEAGAGLYTSIVRLDEGVEERKWGGCECCPLKGNIMYGCGTLWDHNGREKHYLFQAPAFHSRSRRPATREATSFPPASKTPLLVPFKRQ